MVERWAVAFLKLGGSVVANIRTVVVPHASSLALHVALAKQKQEGRIPEHKKGSHEYWSYFMNLGGILVFLFMPRYTNLYCIC